VQRTSASGLLHEDAEHDALGVHRIVLAVERRDQRQDARVGRIDDGTELPLLLDVGGGQGCAHATAQCCPAFVEHMTLQG
jgi:hypothetical protein